jgi:hypothetical protein
MGRILFSIGLVDFGIGAGYLIQVLVKKGKFRLPFEGTRKKLQIAALLFFNPVAILGATWVADIHHIKIAALPFMDLSALLSGGCPAYALIHEDGRTPLSGKIAIYGRALLRQVDPYTYMQLLFILPAMSRWSEKRGYITSTMVM